MSYRLRELNLYDPDRYHETTKQLIHNSTRFMPIIQQLYTELQNYRNAVLKAHSTYQVVVSEEFIWIHKTVTMYFDFLRLLSYNTVESITKGNFSHAIIEILQIFTKKYNDGHFGLCGITGEYHNDIYMITELSSIHINIDNELINSEYKFNTARLTMLLFHINSRNCDIYKLLYRFINMRISAMHTTYRSTPEFIEYTKHLIQYIRSYVTFSGTRYIIDIQERFMDEYNRLDHMHDNIYTYALNNPILHKDVTLQPPDTTDLCSICLNQFDQICVYKTNCNHWFHHDCLVSHCKSRYGNNCPMCRQSIK